MMRRVLLVGVLALVMGGCGGDGRPLVLIASSLRPALDRPVPAVRASFAASDAIAAQIRQGAPADVVVVADPDIIAALTRDGLVDDPQTIARNRLAVLVPRGSRRVTRLSQLAAPGLRLAVAAPGVPLGDYTAEMVARARLPALLDNVAAKEPDAAGVVGKVALGEVDAGIGYASDLATGRVDGFVIPDRFQVDVRYEAAVVRASPRPDAARAYLTFLTGAEARAALTAAGFAAP